MNHASAEFLVRLPSAANLREHWAVRAKHAKAHRLLGRSMAVSNAWLPCVVTLTRVAPRKLDGDNLQRAFKSIRDGIADKLGVDDRDARIEWRYAQASDARPKHYAILVEVARA